MSFHKTKALIVFSFFLLFISLIPTVKSYYLFNFTSSTPIELYETSGEVIDQINVLHSNLGFGKWFVGYNQQCSVLNFASACMRSYLSKWSNDFSTEEISFNDDFYGTNNKGTYFSYALDDTYSKIYALGLTTDVTGVLRENLFILNQSDLVNSTLSSIPYTLEFYSITRDYSVFYNYAMSLPIRYTDLTSISVNSSKLYDGTPIYTPSSLTSFQNYMSIKALFLPTISEYWVFYPDQNKNLMVSRYDYSLNHIKTEIVISSSNFPSSAIGQDFYPDYDVISISRLNIPYVYLVSHVYENNTLWIDVFNPDDTKTSNTLILVDQKIFDLTQNDGSINSSIVSALGLGYDFLNNKLSLFYAYNTTPSASWKLKVLPEIIDCVCNDWINSSCISQTTRKQNRICVPSICEVPIRYISDALCQSEYQVIKYVPKEKCNSCYSSKQLYAYKDSSYSCQPEIITIPDNATNITTIATWKINVHKLETFGYGTPDENYTMVVCNPYLTEFCYSDIFSCRVDSNKTYVLSYNNYNSGEQVTSYFSIGDVTKCNLVKDVFGWNGYGLVGTICVYYQKPCSNTYECKSIGDVISEVHMNELCIVDSSVICSSLGCDETTGRCKTVSISNGDVLSNLITGFSFDNLFGFLLSEVGKNVISIIIISGLTVGLYLKGINDWRVLFGIMLGGILMFSFLSWLNPFISVLWALTLALFYTQMFRSKVSGN